MAEKRPREEGRLGLATPSCGVTALNQAALNPTDNLRDVKHHAGQRFHHPIISVLFNGVEKKYTNLQISEMVLSKLCQMATMTDGDVTIPANRNVEQLCSRMLLCMNEPVGAAIAYCFAQKASLVDGMHILVFGLGGHTINATLLTMEDGIFKVKATDGDTLGGHAFVHRMVGHVVKEFEERNNKKVSGDQIAYCRVWARCEEAVKALSSDDMTTIEVKSLFEGIDLRCSITRDKFEELNMDLFLNCLIPVEKCLKQAGLESGCVQSVVLGCSTKIPRMQHLLQNLLSSEQVGPFINGPDDESFDRSAAVLSDIISSKAPGIPMFDVTAHSLGLMTPAGMVVLIPRNTLIPVRTDRLLATVSDDQSEVQFSVYRVIDECEGREPVNEIVSHLILSGITLASKGVTTIKVCFVIDAKGVLEVSAEDVKQGCSCSSTCSLKVERLVAQSSDK